MPLTLVLGPANSAKAGHVLGAYAGAARRDALLVVPTTQDAVHYTHELAEQGVILGSVMTFAGLAREIARRAGYHGRVVSTIGRRRLLRRVVAGLELRRLQHSATGRGFAAAAAELIAELERTMVTPERFVQALAAWVSEDHRRRDYAHEVGQLYLSYARELERVGRVDSELFAWRALDALRSRPGRWGSTTVFFYGFDDLLAIERDAVETLARVAEAEVTVSLTYEPGRAAFSARAEVVQDLRALATRVTELAALDEFYAPQARDTLHHLERSLFEPAATRLDPGPTVSLLEAGGELAQAELVGAEVLSLLRAGFEPAEIVVVCRSLRHSAGLISSVFAGYGIVVASEHRIPFTHTALGRAVRALARCAYLTDPPAGAEDLLHLLRYPGLVRRVELVDALEAEIRRGDLRTLAQARERWGWELAEIDSLPGARDLIAELAAQARRLFAAPHRGAAPALSPAEALDARALAALLDVLEEARELGQRLSPGELLELLEDLDLPAGEPLRSDSVLLAEPLAIRARRFRAVIVCGLNEGEFPASAAGEPFLSDQYRHELALASGLRLPAREEPLPRERYLLYACLSRATERVVLSYRSSDEEGNLALASPFVADVADLLDPDWVDRRRRRLLANVVWDPTDAPTDRELSRARAAAGEGRPAGDGGGPWRLGENALSHLRHRHIVSAGALEKFAECPVKWLVESQLEPERFAPEPEAMARGNYMHKALEEVFGQIGEPLTRQTLPDALRILEAVVARRPAGVVPGRSEAVGAAVARGYEADLRRYLEAEAGDGCEWPPRAIELRFGFDDERPSLPPVRLQDGSEQILLRGMIDRVDVDPGSATRAIVRDYKSGRSRPEQAAARWSSDRRLQVALYMIGVRQLLGLDAIAGFYQPLRGPDLRPRGMFLQGQPVGTRAISTDGRERQPLDEVLADAESRAVALAGGIRNGIVTPSPQTCSRDGCSYPGICRCT